MNSNKCFKIQNKNNNKINQSIKQYPFNKSLTEMNTGEKEEKGG